MEPMPPPRYDMPAPEVPTARGIAAAYLLILVVFLAMWATSRPVLVAGFAAGAAVAALAVAVRRYAAARRRGDRPRVCVPRTEVCLRL